MVTIKNMAINTDLKIKIRVNVIMNIIVPIRFNIIDTMIRVRIINFRSIIPRAIITNTNLTKDNLEIMKI